MKQAKKTEMRIGDVMPASLLPKDIVRDGGGWVGKLYFLQDTRDHSLYRVIDRWHCQITDGWAHKTKTKAARMRDLQKALVAAEQNQDKVQADFIRSEIAVLRMS